ncbi:hypothetical protein E2C01_059453 [Portunus trituberculatus]|uniref:Uncharacterized protein n=1 Tax=Portunus trituberculatus TaxID=210409 RepID=A0A5B7GZ72_PORTR|nr:hypothetical protein [Portunus trituberculatus]
MFGEGRRKPKLVANIEISKGRGTECAPLWKLNSQRIFYSQRS